MAKTIQFEGQTYNFPDDATDQEISGALSQHTLSQKPEHYAGSSTDASALNKLNQPQQSHFGLTPEHQWTPERLHEFLGVLPAIGGVLGGIPGAAAGAFARQAVAPSPSLTEGAEDTATQGIIPEALSPTDTIPYLSKLNLLGRGKDFLGKIASKVVSTNNPTVSKALGQTVGKFTSPITEPIDEATQAAKANLPTTTQTITTPGTIINPATGQPGNITSTVSSKATTTGSKVGNELINRPAGAGPSEINYKDIFDHALDDVQQVRNFKLATGESDTINQLGLNRAIGKGYNATSKTFEPDKILKELGGDNKEVYNEALDPGTKDRLTGFLNTAKSLQPAQSTGMLSYMKHRLVFDLGAFGIGHAVAGGGLPGMAVGGGSLLLTNQAISKLMSSETLGNLALQSLKLAPSSPVSPIVAKTLLNGLRGTELYLQKGGKEQKVTVGDDGNLVPLK